MAKRKTKAIPAKDSYYDIVRNNLMKDAWIMTYDPFRLAVGGGSVFIDLGASQLFSAQR